MSKKPELTETAVGKLRCPAGKAKAIVADGHRDAPRGFGVRVMASGAKAYIFRYRNAAGADRIATLGEPASLKLAVARERANEMARQVAAGIDPQAQPEAPAPALTFAGALERYAAEHLSGGEGRPRSGPWIKALLDRVSRGAWPGAEVWSDRPLDSIKAEDVLALHAAIRQAPEAAGEGARRSGGPAAANRVLTNLRSFFRWAARPPRRWIEADPTAGLATRDHLAREKPRERTLTDAETRAFWRACERVGYPWGHFGRLLLLTACRRGEIAGLRRAEIADGAILVPAERMKSGRAHLVPLSPQAQAVIDSIPTGADMLFISGARPLSAFTHGLKAIRSAMAEISDEPVPDWTFHDLRRTAATGLQRLGVMPHVAEAVLAHARPKLERIYGTHAYADEKRRALKAWAEHVEQL